MPNGTNANVYQRNDTNSTDARERLTGIASTVTPVRGVPFSRQLSIQHQDNSLRASYANRHPVSFDISDPKSKSSLVNQQPALLNHHQKLLQLQLLHNSNNVDYVRHGFEENQIYYPDSVTNVYGYSSMRSNLKSVASEFSFIRPSSSSGYNQLALLYDGQNTLGQHSIEPQKIHRTHHVKPLIDSNNNGIPTNLLGSPAPHSNRQYLVNPNTGQRLSKEQGQQNITLLSDSPTKTDEAPSRMLPLKPNKKRIVDDLTVGKHSRESTSFSLTGLIRRAFSRRSKRKTRSQLKIVGSYSSSLSPNDHSTANNNGSQTAFSTGSKSVSNNLREDNSMLGKQNRMVDMIEAFNKTTLIDGASVTRIDVTKDIADFNLNIRTPVHAIQRSATKMLSPRNDRFASPLHKSNSISTTTGWDLGESCMNRAYTNDLTSDFLASSSSRSSKVISAHLMPSNFTEEGSTQVEFNNLLFSSPRTRVGGGHNPPRPSSIYGQPSMISSPIFNSRDNRNRFGLQRNSLNYNQLTGDRSSVDLRRTHIARSPLLKPTVEVAEELSSPMDTPVVNNFQNNRNSFEKHHPNDHSRFLKIDQNERAENDPDSPISIGQMRYKQAIVNPILQSPTMGTIYDNHPVLNNVEARVSYSLYDNHCSNDEQGQTNLGTPRRGLQSNYYSSNLRASRESMDLSRSQKPSCITTPNRCLPSKEEQPARAGISYVKSKPSAVVAPSTPDHKYYMDSSRGLINSPSRGHDPANVRSGHVNSTHFQRSPMMSRRNILGPINYQQSPLVSDQTRVVTKSDGKQATIIADNRNLYTSSVIQARKDSDSIASPYYVSCLSSRNENTSNSCGLQPGPDSSDFNHSTARQFSTNTEHLGDSADSNLTAEQLDATRGEDGFEESHEEISSGNGSTCNRGSRRTRERKRLGSQPSSTGSPKRESSSDPSEVVSSSGSPSQIAERNWITSKLIN